MKIRSSAVFLLIVVSAVCSQTSAQPERSGNAHAAAAQTRIFTSELGYELSYPAEWIYNDIGPVVPASKMPLDKEAEQDAYRRSIECSQNIFSARFGEPRSNFLGGVITTDCMREKPDLDTFTSRTMRLLESRYKLSDTHYAAYSVQGQMFWVMRSKAASWNEPGELETIEYVATVLPKGLVYWSVHSKMLQAQEDFEHSHLHLANGVDTELIPAGAFEATKSPSQPFTSLGSAQASDRQIFEEPHASHYFNSGYGFTYEVPPDLKIYDAKRWDAANRMDSPGKPVPSKVPEARRLQTLLVAMTEDQSKTVILTVCTLACLATPVDASNSPAYGLDYAMVEEVVSLGKKYNLKNTEYGTFKAGTHRFWAMRSTAILKDRPWETPRSLATLMTLTSRGVVEYFLLGKTRSDLDALMATHLNFEDGAETELIPNEAFATTSGTLSSSDQQAPVLPSTSMSAALEQSDTPKTAPEPSTAQKAAPEAAAAPKTPPDYSAEPLVIDHVEHIYTMAADGTGVRQVTLAARVNSDASVRQLGVLSIPYASSSEHVELAYVRVRRPDGSVTETPLTSAIEMPTQVTTAAPFYSDLKELQIPVRNLRAGDHLEWQAKVIRTKPDAPGQFWGQETFVPDNVVLSESLELHVPKDKYVNVWSPANKPVETTTPTEHIYRWDTSQLKPTVGPEAEAEKDRKKKQLWTAEQEIEEKEGKSPSVAWTTFKSWDEVGAWYRALESDRVLSGDPEIKAKVVELTAGKATQEEKVRAIYAYVSTQIRYVGVDFGIGRYQPHTAVEVLENQYGDCKDKHTLLAAMLENLGLHPAAVLIGAGIRFNEPVPSPQSFNHLITWVSVDGQPIWLDTTAEVAPYRVLSYVLRDKAALVVPNSGLTWVEHTPASLPFPAIEKMDAVGTLDEDGISNSRLVLTLRGDGELIAREAFHRVPLDQYDKIVQHVSLGMGYAGTTSHPDVSRPEDTNEPLTISYDYKREKAGDWEHLRTVPQVAPVELPRPGNADPPVSSIFLGPPRTEISTSAMKIPDGWGAKLPDAVDVKSPWAAYSQTYRFENRTIYAERRVEVFEERVPFADWKAYKKFADDADLGNEKFIQLITPGGWAPIYPSRGNGPSTSTATATSLEDSKAARLIAAAHLSIQHRQFEAAQSQLDEAHSIDPDQPRLWTNYGYLEFQRGNMSSAITDYRKELALYPDNYGTYPSLAEAQHILGLEKDAHETLKKWSIRQPDNIAPITALVSMLIDEGQFSEAVAAAKTGIARLPEERKNDQRLQLLIGRAQIAAGMQQGESTLLDLLHATTDPGMMNDAAYELGKTGLDLPLAEAAARDAIDKLTAESKTWNLQENVPNSLSKSRRIASTWDTLGWILYREGKSTEAESYIQPAWTNRESAEIGEHLAEMAEAKGNLDEALRLYELALATFPSYLQPGFRKTPNATQKELTQHIETLRKAGAKEPAADADDTLRQLRTIDLGPSSHFTGGAEYRLLLSNGAVLDLEKTGDKEVPLAEEKIKAARFPGYWPNGSEAKLVRLAMLNCSAGSCELVLEP
jgi:tetratricopeptide (TPR) repeat protein